jgi:hypothetical protein
MISHGGGIPGFTTNALYLPDADVFVAVFSNRSSPRHANPAMVANKLAAAAIGEPFPEFTAIDLPEAALRRFVGVYKVGEDSQRIVSIRDGALHTQRDGAAWTRAQPSSETGFFYPLNLTHFEFVVQDGQVTGMLMYQNGSEVAEEAVKVSDEVPAPRQAITLDRGVLERYVGVYELAPGFELNVYVEGDRLMTQATGQGSIPIDAASETEFFVEAIGAEITFVLDADGTATELVLRQAGREMRGQRRR